MKATRNASGAFQDKACNTSWRSKYGYFNALNEASVSLIDIRETLVAF